MTLERIPNKHSYAKKKLFYLSILSATDSAFMQPLGLAATITQGIASSSVLTFCAGIATYGLIFVQSALTHRLTVKRFIHDLLFDAGCSLFNFVIVGTSA